MDYTEILIQSIVKRYSITREIAVFLLCHSGVITTIMENPDVNLHVDTSAWFDQLDQAVQKGALSYYEQTCPL